MGLHDVVTVKPHSGHVNTWAASAAKPSRTEAGAGKRPKSRAGPPQGRRSPAPRPALADAALVVAGVGLGATTALTITVESVGQLTATGGLATFAGNLTGMVGTYLALLMVLLVSRIPFVEQVVGQDGLLRWHRRLAPWPISLLIAHALLLVAGYAQAARSGPWHELNTLLFSYPDVLIATIGLGLSFVGHPLTRLVWSVTWAATAGVVLAYRVGLPVLRSFRYRLRVAEVRPEGPGVVSVICQGQHLDRLAVSGGQFFFWRFLTRDMWWQAHPYSLSALPQPPFVRLTVKGVGDHSAALARVRPGTRVAIEGPYGIFTRHSQRRSRVLLIAAGIGVTAVRALLEDLPRSARPVVLLRATQRADLVLGTEIADLVKRRGGQLHELTGNRMTASIDQYSLRHTVPDLNERDLYVCGPEAFVTGIVEVARSLGLPDEAIHHEAFAL